MTASNPAVQAQKHFAALLQRLPEGTVSEKQVNNDVALYNTNTARGYAHGADRIELAKPPRLFGAQHQGKDLSAKHRRNAQVEMPSLNQIASLLNAVNAKTDTCVTENDYAITLYRLLDQGYNLRARLSQEPEETASYLRIRKKLAEVDGEAATLEDANQMIKKQRLEIGYWKEEAAKLRAVPEALYGVRAAIRRLKAHSDELKQTVRYQNLDSQDLVQQFARTYKTYSGIDVLSDTKVLEKKAEGSTAGAGALSIVKQAELGKDMAEYLQTADPFRDSKTTLATALQLLSEHVTEITQRTPLVPDPLWDTIKWDDDEDSPENLKKKRNIPSFANLGKTIGVTPVTELPKKLSQLAAYNRPTPELGLVRAAVVACKHVSTTFGLISTLSKIRLDLQTELEAAKTQILQLHVELKDSETKGGKSTRGGGSTMMGGAPTTERKAVAAAVQRLQENGRAKVRELSRFAVASVPVSSVVDEDDEEDLSGTVNNGSANFATSLNPMTVSTKSPASSLKQSNKNATRTASPQGSKGKQAAKTGRPPTGEKLPEQDSKSESQQDQQPLRKDRMGEGNSDPLVAFVNQWTPKPANSAPLAKVKDGTTKPKILTKEMGTQTSIGPKERKVTHSFVENDTEKSNRDQNATSYKHSSQSTAQPSFADSALSLSNSQFSSLNNQTPLNAEDQEATAEDVEEHISRHSSANNVEPLHVSLLASPTQQRDHPISAVSQPTEHKEVMTATIDELIEYEIQRRGSTAFSGADIEGNFSHPRKEVAQPQHVAHSKDENVNAIDKARQGNKKDYQKKKTKEKRQRNSDRMGEANNDETCSSSSVSGDESNEARPAALMYTSEGESSNSDDTETFSEGEMLYDLGWIRDATGIVREKENPQIIISPEMVEQKRAQMDLEEENHRRRRRNRREQRKRKLMGEVELSEAGIDSNGRRRQKSRRSRKSTSSTGNNNVPTNDMNPKSNELSKLPTANRTANVHTTQNPMLTPPSPIPSASLVATPIHQTLVRERNSSVSSALSPIIGMPSHVTLPLTQSVEKSGLITPPPARLVPLSPLAPVTLTAVQRKDREGSQSGIHPPPPEQSIKQAMAMMRGARMGSSMGASGIVSDDAGLGVDNDRISTATTNRTTKSRRSIIAEARPIMSVSQATMEDSKQTRPAFHSPGAVVSEDDHRAVALNETRQMLCALKSNSTANPFAKGNYEVRASHQLIFNPAVQIASGPKESTPLQRIGGAL